MGFAIAAGVIAAGATAYAAKSASDSASQANKTNIGRARAQRELEERLFHEGRGSAGHAILPEYGGDFEKRSFEDLVKAYDANIALGGTPEERLAGYEGIRERFQPVFEAGSEVVDSIYSGAMDRERLAEAQPVMAARTALARTQKQGILDDIQARLAALDSANARRGFVGSGTAAQNAALRTTLPFYQRAAGVGAQATLENELQAQAIKESGRDLRLRSLDLPATRARQALQFRALPGDFLSESSAARLKPFSAFNIGTSSFRPTPLPLVSPVPGMGQIVASGVGQLTGTAGNVYANQQLMNQMNAMSQPKPTVYNPWEYQPGSGYDFSPVPMWGGGYG